MKKLGYGLMSLPIVLFIAAGLIFDTADFLIALGVFALIALPIFLGGYLIMRADR